MKQSLLLGIALGMVGNAGGQEESAPTGMFGGPADGIRWTIGFSKGSELAKKEGKPLMVLHLLGRLDEEFC
jgi:hypothetical protein